MRSLKLLGQTLGAQTDHKQAIVVLKHLLQLAWVSGNHYYEMKAYEMIGQQYFYLRNLDKAGYYMERFKRGYFELPCSKIRELSKLQYTQKQENRDC